MRTVPAGLTACPEPQGALLSGGQGGWLWGEGHWEARGTPTPALGDRDAGSRVGHRVRDIGCPRLSLSQFPCVSDQGVAGLGSPGEIWGSRNFIVVESVCPGLLWVEEKEGVSAAASGC